MSRRSGKAPIDEAEQQRLRDEQQRLRDEAEVRRIEDRRLEIERQLQYASPPLANTPVASTPLANPPWTPFGLSGNPGITEDDLWRDLNVNISYEDMHHILNEDREWEERERAVRERAEREESTSDEDGGGGGGGGAGGEKDIPMPEIMIKMRRGRRSSSTGQLVDVKGKFDIN